MVVPLVTSFVSDLFNFYFSSRSHLTIGFIILQYDNNDYNFMNVLGHVLSPFQHTKTLGDHQKTANSHKSQ